MHSMMIFSLKRYAAAGLLLLAGLVTACSESTGPGEDFLIRLPSDNLASATVATFTASSSSESQIHFEWEPALGATEYTITFWRAEDRDQMRLLEADYTRPAFAIETGSAEVVEVPFNADDPDDLRTLAVVQHEVGLSDLASHLAELGAEPGDGLYFVWTVYAHKGSKMWRSSETHRMVLNLE
jgi:hypothetical protein